MTDAAPRVGVEPMRQVVMMENHDEAYRIWRKTGTTGRILVHLDAHPDMVWMGEGQFLNIANFICPALRERLVREVYWIVPDPSWIHRRTRRALRRYMERLLARYPGPHPPPRVTEEAITLTAMETLIHIRPLQHFPTLTEPVLLDIDTDFFVITLLPDHLASPPPRRPWCWPATVVGRLRQQRLRSDLVTIAYSVEGGYTPLRWRYLGDELAEQLRHPQCAPATADSWMLKRRAAMALVDGRAEEARRGYEALLERDPHDAAACFGLAEASARRGLGEEARQWYQRAVGEHPGYQSAKDGTALGSLRSKRLDPAERACRQMLMMNPRDGRSWYVRGRVAISRRQWLSALDHLRQATTFQPTLIDAHLAMAEVLGRLGRVEEAIAAYEQALVLGLARSSTLDETFIATDLSVEHRINRTHFKVYAALAWLYTRAHRPREASQSAQMWLAAGALGGVKELLTMARYFAAQGYWRQALGLGAEAVACWTMEIVRGIRSLVARLVWAR